MDCYIFEKFYRHSLVVGRGINEVTSYVIGFCDSDYAENLDCRRSLPCYIFTFGGSVVSWHATLQFNFGSDRSSKQSFMAQRFNWCLWY